MGTVEIDPSKHPFSAALYNAPKRKEKKVANDWGGGHEEYVGRHRKGSKGCALVLLALAAPLIYGIVEVLS